jgi:hypothetical protein
MGFGDIGTRVTSVSLGRTLSWPVHFSIAADIVKKALDKGGEFCYNLGQMGQDLARASEKI